MEGFTQQQIRQYVVVEFYDASLMDSLKLEEMGKRLYHLVDQEDKRCIVLDFSRVQYISSQFIGILMALQKRLKALPKSELLLCSVNSRLAELLRITRLDQILKIYPSQKEAVQERHV